MSLLTRRHALTAAVGLLSLTALTGPAAKAQGPASAPAAQASASAALSPDEQKAREALAKMVTAYQGLKSFGATVQCSAKSGGNTSNSTAKVAYKPGKVRVDAKDDSNSATVVYDGDTVYSTNSADPKTYRKVKPASAQEAIGRTLGTNTVTGLLPLLLLDPNVGKKILPPNAKDIKIADGDPVNGAAVQVVSASMPVPSGNGTLRFEIGKEDNLLRRISLDIPKSGQAPATTITETYADVKANPAFPATTFVFTPAPGMTLAENKPTGADPAEPPMYDVRLKEGAAPLPFAGTDTEGKAVDLAQYKGKVVLLDFWATWCPPCREEVPNVIAAYKKYHSQGFDVIGISLDKEGDKPKLVSFTTDNKMPWRQIYDGGYWQAKLAVAYGVQAIPFTLLIGKDGKIAAVNARGEELEPAVKAALAK